MNAVPGITENEAKYLKHIYRKQHEESQDIHTTGLATSLGVRPATVTEVLQTLDEKELLHYTPYRGVQLTERGRQAAETFLRKHRILETLLTDTLAYTPDEACRESLRLDYHASTRLIDAICRTLGHPKVCPCGKTIFRGAHCKEHTDGDIDE